MSDFIKKPAEDVHISEENVYSSKRIRGKNSL